MKEIELSERCLDQLCRIAGKDLIENEDIESTIWEAIKTYWTMKNIDSRM